MGVERVDVAGSVRYLHSTVVAAKGAGCIKTASVTRVELEDAAPVWRVTAMRDDQCISIIDYGRQGAGLAQEVPAHVLRAGVAYRVRLSGSGFSVTRDFVISQSGALAVID